MQVTKRERLALAQALRESRRAMAGDYLSASFVSLAGTELSVAQLATLFLLDSMGEEEPTVQQLSVRLRRSVSATSRLLSGLVRRKLVRRRTDPDDRRALRLSLADGGRKFLDAMLDARTEAQLQLVEALDPEERREVARGMSLLAKAALKRSQHEQR